MNILYFIIMSATFLPSILVPLVGLVFPGIAIGAFFLYSQKEFINLLYFSILLIKSKNKVETVNKSIEPVP